MTKRILSAIATLVCIMCTSVAQFPKDLRFGHDGEFKILQISNCVNTEGVTRNTGELLTRLIKMESPQLVVFTIGGAKTCDPSKAAAAFAAVCKNVPYVVVSSDRNENKVLAISNPDGTTVEKAVYLINGNMDFDQVAWYRKKCEENRFKNFGENIPAVAFLLKPTPEFKEAIIEFGDKKTDGKLTRYTGNRISDISCEENNSGLFTSMHECGDVSAVFCGYDDGNDFALVWKNILLAYGRNTRLDGTLDFGARVIILKEHGNDILTYIRNAENQVIDKCSYPGDFPVTK